VLRCPAEIFLKKSNDSLVDAAKVLVEKRPDCQLCSPEKCHEHHVSLMQGDRPSAGNNHDYKFKYWRFDRIAPKFTNPTTLTLHSIPKELRIRPSRFNDIGKYFQEQFWTRQYASSSSNVSSSSSMDFLLEYNPGIVTLPPNLKKHLPSEAAYLVSLRVTPANNCFPTHAYDNLPKDVWEAVYHTSVNHLGLALLDSQYNMMPGYEAVIEVDSQLDLKRVVKRGSSDFSPTFMDYRIFLLNGQVYLHANADTTVVTKLKLKAKGYDTYATDADSTNKDPSDDEKGKVYRNYKLQNLYGGDMLQVSVEHQFNTIWSGGLYGKNYALFGIPNKTHPDAEDAVYAEIDIAPDHRVQRVILDEYDHSSLYGVFG
jgi:hypothetical protein